MTGSAGQTSFGATGASIGAGGGNSLTFTAPVAYSAGMTTNPLVNTATASDGVHPPVSASDSDTLSADVALDGDEDRWHVRRTYRAATVSYTIVVTNTGISDAVNVSVNDTLPAGVMLDGAVTCSAIGNASCGVISGAPNFTAAGASVGAGAGNALTYTVPVSFAANLTAATITNVVTVTDVPSGANASASDTDSLAQSGPTLAKTIAPPTIGVGGSATLTITLGQSERGAADADRTVRRHDARRRDDDRRQHRHVHWRRGDGDDDHDGQRRRDSGGRLHDRRHDHVVDRGYGHQHHRHAEHQRRKRAARQRPDHGDGGGGGDCLARENHRAGGDLDRRECDLDHRARQ